MNPAARRLFEEVVDLPSEERAARVRAECAGDDGLKREVESLIRSYEAAAGFMSDPSISLSSLPVPDPTPIRATDAGATKRMQDCSVATIFEKPGDMIGRYRLLAEIGEGGFGVVFRAEQVEPVKRDVALKVIKVGMDTRDRIARFDAERQALALMDHPNIARVFDAGATSTGRLYFVMELVQGTSITRYCDANKLGVVERLKLFRQVCSAVQHAHQKGIIHRDIKPSNVLVTTLDDEPVPKVIDFGIAKAVRDPLTERTLFTDSRQAIGTPAYMSPEQADNANNDIDTRTDVYSLGVLLYELLTGVTPLDFSNLSSIAADEMVRMIRHQEPIKPSLRLSKDSSATILADRRSDSRKLGAALRRDLDWIVMRCIEKDRTRRYETAQSLSEDIQRYLANEPVQAGPPSASYRAMKYYKRHRPWVLVAAGTLVVTAGFVAALIASNVQTRRERDDSLLAQAAAQASAANFALALINSLNSTQGTLAHQSIRAPLLKLDQQIGDTDWSRLPRLEYDMRQGLAVCYESIGEIGAAQSQVARLDTLAAPVGLPKEAALRAIVSALYEQANLKSKAGDMRAAVVFLERAQEYLAAINDNHSEQYARVRVSYASASVSTRGVTHSEAILRDAITIASSQPRSDQALVAEARYSLASILRSLGKPDDAFVELKQALAIREADHGQHSSHVDIVKCIRLFILIEADRKQVDQVCAWTKELLKRVLPDLGSDMGRSNRMDAIAAVAYADSAFEISGQGSELAICMPDGLAELIESDIEGALIETPSGSSVICQGMLVMRMLCVMASDYEGAEAWARRAFEMCSSQDDWPTDVTRRSRMVLGKMYEKQERIPAAVAIYKDLVAFEQRRVRAGKPRAAAALAKSEKLLADAIKKLPSP